MKKVHDPSKWVCPLCSCNAAVKDVYVDMYVKSILETCPLSRRIFLEKLLIFFSGGFGGNFKRWFVENSANGIEEKRKCGGFDFRG